MRLGVVGSFVLGLASVAGLGLDLSSLRAEDSPPAEIISPSEPRTPAEERRGFHLPAGFEAQLVAAEPDISKPLNIAFDDRGRLWVSDTLEYPFPSPPGSIPRDSVKVLDDFGPDGRARSITTFADGLTIPIGVLPLPSCRSALVYSIPEILRLTDTDGDGRADRRESLYRSFGSQDTHGMTNSFTWGFDGWIYACHGYANTSHVRGSDGAALTMQSGSTYRMRPDGTHLEGFAPGRVNPFGLAFDPLGNLYSCDSHTQPVTMLLRGACYPNGVGIVDGLGFGPAMTRHPHGSTGIAGIAYYAAAQFPPPYRDTLFVGNVVTNRIHLDRMAWTGSSPWVDKPADFLRSEDSWFRPVDLELGPDGALYVADFYNRIIGHHEVPLTHPGRDRRRGRIWRIVYRGPGGQRAVPPRADRTQATVRELVEDLGHTNLAVRHAAANQLVDRGGRAGVEAVHAALAAEGSLPRQRVHGLWVLSRLAALDDARLVAAARDGDRELRVHALRVLAEKPAWSGPHRELALRGLRDVDPFVRRAAAEAMGQHPDPSQIRPLLDLRRSTVDPGDAQLTHAVRMALREQLRSAGACDRLAALIRDGRDARDLAGIATAVPTAEAARFLLWYIGRYEDPLLLMDGYIRQVARFGDDDTEARLVQRLRSRRQDDAHVTTALALAWLRGARGVHPPRATRRGPGPVSSCGACPRTRAARTPRC